VDTFPPQGAELTRLLVVSDVETSKRWYVDVLGATLHREYGGTSVVLQLLGAWLVLVTGGGPTEDKPTTKFATPPDPDTISSQMIFGVPDCKAAYEALKERGADFLTPPVEYDWETRAFFRDPDGHLFEISQSRSDE
jgi:catechol 2,3-dioxygenase-like lactoylglutathione lyase family enzyme